MEEVGEIEAINDQARLRQHQGAGRVLSLWPVSNKAIDNAAFDLVAFVLYKIRKAWEILRLKKNYSR